MITRCADNRLVKTSNSNRSPMFQHSWESTFFITLYSVMQKIDKKIFKSSNRASLGKSLKFKRFRSISAPIPELDIGILIVVLLYL